jgi:hypothetical protein
MLGFAKGTWKIAKCRLIQATSELLNTVESTMRPNMRDTISYVSLVIKFVVRYKAIELHTKQYFYHHQRLLHRGFEGQNYEDVWIHRNTYVPHDI